jgi:hypothetical protein
MQVQACSSAMPTPALSSLSVIFLTQVTRLPPLRPKAIVGTSQTRKEGGEGTGNPPIPLAGAWRAEAGQ